MEGLTIKILTRRSSNCFFLRGSKQETKGKHTHKKKKKKKKKREREREGKK